MNSEETQIRLAGIIRESIVDGPGIRFVVFGQGCPHNCPGCHNPQSHDFEAGKDYPVSRVLEAVDKNPLLDGVTFSGGEPFCQPEAFAALGKELKKRNLNIVSFTGYTYEELLEKANSDSSIGDMLAVTDLLIDGRFIEAEKDLTLSFRGSRNQRVIDMNKTRETGEITLWDEY